MILAYKNELRQRLASLSFLGKAERSVMQELIARCDEGGVAWPSFATISKQTGYSVKTIQRATKLLSDQCLIRRRRRSVPKTYRGSYVYAITLPETRHSEPSSGQNDIAKRGHNDRSE